MQSQLNHENRSTCANIAAALSFPYIWIGLFLLLYKLFGISFFGRGFNGGLVSVLLCLGVLNPAVPGALATYVAKPLFSNLLARELVTTKGCLSGIVTMIVGLVLILYFLARDMQTALLVFVAAPVVAVVLAVAVSLIENNGSRGGGMRKPGGGSAKPIAPRRAPSLPPGPSSRPKAPDKSPARPDRPRLPGK